MKILGIQYYSMSALKWLDKETSVSWLRAFENFEGHECYALLKEHNYTGKIEYPIRGVKYYFVENINISSITKYIIEVSPDVILYNFCNYSELADILKSMQIRFPWCLHIVRTHHECKRVLYKELVIKITENCDSMIVSNLYDKKYIKEINPNIPCEIIPFGVNINIQINSKVVKDIDVISSCGNNPVKRPLVLKEIFLQLDKQNFITKNLIGLHKTDYIKELQRGKIFLNTSVSEASGSRSLLEAIIAGCYPIITQECESALDICKDLGIPYTCISVNHSIDEVVKIIKEIPQNSIVNLDKIHKYSDTTEINTLQNIILLWYNQFVKLKHSNFSKNVIRKLACDIVFNCTKKENNKKLYWFQKKIKKDVKDIKDLKIKLKRCLTSAQIYYCIDKIWEDCGLPIASLYGFKDKMHNDDFDFEKNCSWILET